MVDEVYTIDKLKRCPFCGEKPVINYIHYFGISLEMFCVVCPACSATIKDAAGTEDEAVKRWNRRIKYVSDKLQKDGKTE